MHQKIVGRRGNPFNQYDRGSLTRRRGGNWTRNLSVGVLLSAGGRGVSCCCWLRKHAPECSAAGRKRRRSILSFGVMGWRVRQSSQWPKHNFPPVQEERFTTYCCLGIENSNWAPAVWLRRRSNYNERAVWKSFYVDDRSLVSDKGQAIRASITLDYYTELGKLQPDHWSSCSCDKNVLPATPAE